MRRMKNEPMTFYPVTELDETSSNYIAFYLNRDITKRLKSSPHAIHLLIETTAAGCADYGGSFEFKMMPTKSIYNDNLIYAYFDSKITDNNKRIIAYCYLHDEDDQLYVHLELGNLDGTAVTDYGDKFSQLLTTYESHGLGLENLINVSVEPVSISVSVLSTEI